MSAKSEAFIRVSAKCPVCDRETVNRYVKSKMFTPVETEGDRFVKVYRAELPQYNDIRPEYFHIWHCPHCHFCDEKEVFRGEDNSGGKLELLKDKLLIEMRRPQNLMLRLSETIDFYAENISWNSALAAHILAIHIQLLLSVNTRQVAKLARLYLRAAWLWREREYFRAERPAAYDAPALELIIDEFRESWPDGPFDEATCLSKAIEHYKLDLDQTGRTDDVRHETGIMFLIVALLLRIDEKREAMSYIQMVFRQCTQQRMSAQKSLDVGVRSGKVTGNRIEQIKSLIQWLNNTIERTVALSERVTKEIFKEEYPRAREIVLTMGETSPDEILKRLREEGLFEGTCRRVSSLYKKQMLLKSAESVEEAQAAPAEPPKEEKGLFGKIANIFRGDEDPQP